MKPAIKSLLLVLLGSLWACLAGCGILQADKLSIAAENGDVHEIYRLIATGVPVDGRAMHDMTALMNAAGKGQLASCKALIEKGADINAHNQTCSVLMEAIGSGNAQLVHLLLVNGVDIGWKNALGETAVVFARASGKDSLADMIQDFERLR